MTPPTRGKDSQRGLTLIELMVVIALMGMACYSMTLFIQNTRVAASRQEATGELLRRDLRSISNLRSGLQGCVELIANYGDATGDALLPLRTLVYDSVTDPSAAEAPASNASGQAAPMPVTFTGWPTVVTTRQVDMSGDTGDAAWGDELMYVAELNPVTFTAYFTQSGSSWVVGTSSTSQGTDAEVLSIDRYQFVYDYLTWDPNVPVAGFGQGLRLAEWRSQPVIAYSSLSALTDTPSVYADSTCCPRLDAALQELTAMHYTTAFDPTAVTLSAGADCFYSLASESNISNGVSESLPTSLPMYSWSYLDDFDLVQSYDAQPDVDLGRITRADGNAGGQVVGQSGYSVALNTGADPYSNGVPVYLAGPVGPTGAALTVPIYAEVNQPATDGMFGAGFPAGFEVTVCGQVDSREIYLHLVMMASNLGTSVAHEFLAQSEDTEISVSPHADF